MCVCLCVNMHSQRIDWELGVNSELGGNKEKILRTTEEPKIFITNISIEQFINPIRGLPIPFFFSLWPSCGLCKPYRVCFKRHHVPKGNEKSPVQTLFVAEFIIPSSQHFSNPRNITVPGKDSTHNLYMKEIKVKG